MHLTALNQVLIVSAASDSKMVGQRRHRASVIDSKQAQAKLSDAQIDAVADFDKLHLDSKDSIALTTMKLDYYYGLGRSPKYLQSLV